MVYGGVSYFFLCNCVGKEFILEIFKEGIDYVYVLDKKVYVIINGFFFNL